MKKLLLVSVLGCAHAPAPRALEASAPPVVVPGVVRDCGPVQWVNGGARTLEKGLVFVVGAGGLASLNPAPGQPPPRWIPVSTFACGAALAVVVGIEEWTDGLLKQCIVDAARKNEAP